MNLMTLSVLLMFNEACKEYCKKYNTTLLPFSKVSYKNFLAGLHNSKGCVKKDLRLADVLNEKNKIIDTIYSTMSCPISDGSAAAILVSEKYLLQHPELVKNAIEIVDQEIVSDTEETFNSSSYMNLVGAHLAEIAAKRVFDRSGLTIRDVDVIELHDCFSSNEIFMYEALGLCKKGEGHKLIDTAKLPRGKKIALINNRWVVNPSGGLESKGHPIGATGLAQCYEICHQLRGTIENKERQIPHARVGLQHNYGIGSSCVVTLYRKYNNLSKL